MAGEVKVAMTGTGGDELFGNYGKFGPLEGGRWARILGHVPTADAESFRRKYVDAFCYANDDEKTMAILARSPGPEGDTGSFLFDRFRAAASKNLRNQVASLDCGTQLSEEFLMMTDRFSMAHSIEARTPFLDHQLVESVMSIDPRLRLANRPYKKLLRNAVHDLLPPELLRAPKRGFTLPLSLWLRGPLRKTVRSLLSPKRLSDQGYFRPTFYDDLVAPYLESRNDRTNLVWAALMFAVWHLLFVEGHGDVDSLDLTSMEA
jgi:asparagine synthase (glutamine-hydrolysing)